MMMMGDIPPVTTSTPPESSASETEIYYVPLLIRSGWRHFLVTFSIALIGLGVLLAVMLSLEAIHKRHGNHEGVAPAPGPGVYRVAAPLFSPLPSLAVAEPNSRNRDLAPYETICNTTINPDDCLAMFRGYSEAGDLKRWTVKAMEAAQQAINESYVLAQSLKKENKGSVALQQCIVMFADALGNVNKSIFLVKSTNMSGGAADVQILMSAAMTNCETCREGIEDFGFFPGSERITGLQAKHVDTMLSIALTFVNHLSSTPTVDRYQNRRLLHANGSGDSFSGVIPAMI